MVSGHYECAACVGQWLAAKLRNWCRGSADRPQCCGAERHDDAGRERADLRIEPDTAGLNVPQLRSFMQPAFSAWLPIEMLHCVGNEYLHPLDLRLRE